jgi:hypothetical protein
MNQFTVCCQIYIKSSLLAKSVTTSCFPSLFPSVLSFFFVCFSHFLFWSIIPFLLLPYRRLFVLCYFYTMCLSSTSACFRSLLILSLVAATPLHPRVLIISDRCAVSWYVAHIETPFQLLISDTDPDSIEVHLNEQLNAEWVRQACSRLLILHMEWSVAKSLTEVTKCFELLTTCTASRGYDDTCWRKQECALSPLIRDLVI